MRKSWYKNKSLTVLLHAVAWIIWISLPALLAPPHSSRAAAPTEGSGLQGYFRSIMQLSWIGVFYLIFYMLIPRLAYKKKYWLFAFFLILVLMWMIAQSWLLFGIWGQPKHFDISRNVLINFLIYLFILASSTAYRLINDKIKAERKAKDTEYESLKTELSLLRSQVNPHFMFNILNNIVAMARKHSEDLEPSLIKLSSLMRLSFGMKHLFAKAGEELTFDASYFAGRSENHALYSTNKYSAAAGSAIKGNNLQKILGDGNDMNFILQSDYIKPITPKIKLEAGVRGAFRSRENKQQLYC